MTFSPTHSGSHTQVESWFLLHSLSLSYSFRVSVREMQSQHTGCNSCALLHHFTHLAIQTGVKVNSIYHCPVCVLLHSSKHYNTHLKVKGVRDSEVTNNCTYIRHRRSQQNPFPSIANCCKGTWNKKHVCLSFFSYAEQEKHFSYNTCLYSLTIASFHTLLCPLRLWFFQFFSHTVSYMRSSIIEERKRAYGTYEFQSSNPSKLETFLWSWNHCYFDFPLSQWQCTNIDRNLGSRF